MKKDEMDYRDVWLEPEFMRVSGDGTDFIVVLIGLVIIFKKQLVSLVEKLLSKVTSQSNSI